jgi:ribulose-5-phosphate 4-epimerase/fuculose-1-phosphate aldolase
MLLDGKIAYHDYEGPSVTTEEVERLGADLGDKTVMFLRSHGCLIAGANIAGAFTIAHDLHRACETQIALLSAGIGNIHPPSERSCELARERAAIPAAHAPEWPGLLRRLERLEPDYKL